MIMSVLIPAYDYMQGNTQQLTNTLFGFCIKQQCILKYMDMLLWSKNQMLAFCMFCITFFASLHYNFALILFIFPT